MIIDLLPRKTAAPLEAHFVRELTLADAALLKEVPAERPSALKRITDRHHALASALAAGVPSMQAAAYYGYSAQTVSALKTDPTFKELVDVYRSQDERLKRDLFAKLTGIARDALDTITERLEDDEERKKIPMTTLMEIVKLGANRTGYGEASTVNQNVNVFSDMANKMRERRNAGAPRQIEGTAKVVNE